MTAWVVPLGEGEVEVSVPAGWSAELAAPPEHPVLADLDAAIAVALDRPVAGPPLSELAAEAVARAARDLRRPRVVIAVTDATRECPDDRFLPPLIDRLRSGGIADDDIMIVVATGLHRASTEPEKATRLGPGLVGRHRIVDHDAGAAGALVDLGRTRAGVPIV